MVGQTKPDHAARLPWGRAPRPELLPGMGPAVIGGLRMAAQARSNSAISATPVRGGQLRVIGEGRALEPGIRHAAEAFFQTDLSGVRVHEGPAARAMGALAFTLGEDLHFAPGWYDPASRAGLELLGHELTHVVQQRAGLVFNPFGEGVAIVQDPALEAEADRLGQEIAREVWEHPGAASIADSRGAVKHRRNAWQGQTSWRHRGVIGQMKPSRIAGGHAAREVPRVAQRMEEEPSGERDSSLSLSDELWTHIARISAPQDRVRLSIVNRRFHGIVHVAHEQLDAQAALEAKQWPEIAIEEITAWDQTIQSAVIDIGLAWRRRGGNPDKVKQEHQCSGDSWNENDEGADVAQDLLEPENRTRDLARRGYQRTFTARYNTSNYPIAVMIVEARKWNKLVYLYIRWLLAHPLRRGGASKLVKTAKEIAEQEFQSELHVDSARSAETWYEKQGFDFVEDASHEDGFKPCGCKTMTWNKL